MASTTRVAAVTGANKGIGLAIVRQLALKYPSSSFNTGPLIIYLTARSTQRGQDALSSLQKDSQLSKASALSSQGGLTTLRFHELDISSFSSVQAFAKHVKSEHPDGIDFLINNAAIALDGFDLDIVKQTLRTNYQGTLEMCNAFMPLMKSGGRVVNVSSEAGRLSVYSDEVRKRFLRAAKTGVKEVTAIMDDFTAAVADGKEKEQGFPSRAYAVSKAGETAVTKVLAMEEQRKGSKVLVNACCPGYVNTDMSKGNGMLTVDQGARTPIMLALDDIGGKTGDFWRDGRVNTW